MSIFPASLQTFFLAHQDLLWLTALAMDLGFTVLMYRLFGKQGLPTTEMPAVDQPVMGTIGYHYRAGGHDLTPYDWQCYMDFADKHLGKPTAK